MNNVNSNTVVTALQHVHPVVKEESIGANGLRPVRGRRSARESGNVIAPPDTVRVTPPAALITTRRPRRGVGGKVFDLPDDGTDLNFDEFLDLMERLPDDDKACWEAWRRVNNFCYAEDILDAVKDYRRRVPQLMRILPEEWLNRDEYMRCAPWSTQVNPK